MAGSSFFALFDDIATMLDDVAVMSKVALRKTAGVLGDDLALNAQQVTGVPVNREIPVVLAVARGSLINKVILVPAALLISAFAPWGVTPLLMVGGLFLCYEGCEKLVHKFFPEEGGHGRAERVQALQDPSVDMVDFEKTKIKGAVRTDFILSAEIIAITLGAVAGAPFGQQVIVLSGIALLMTVGVYGLVAGIVKLDDLGLYMAAKTSAFTASVGRGIVAAAPYLMKTLSIVGTAAMFMVGGQILVHGIAPLHHAVEAVAAMVGSSAGSLVQTLTSIVLNALAGVVAGAVTLVMVKLIGRLVKKGKHA